MVATPLAAILDWAMGTPAGFAAFRYPRINGMLKMILAAWCGCSVGGIASCVPRCCAFFI